MVEEDSKADLISGYKDYSMLLFIKAIKMRGHVRGGVELKQVLFMENVDNKL